MSDNKPSKFKVGDYVYVQIGLRTSIGTIVEDRGFIGASSRHLFRIKIDTDPPNYIELPEDELG